MLKLELSKQILQARGRKYSDEEVKQIRAKLYELANIVSDLKEDNEKLEK